MVPSTSLLLNIVVSSIAFISFTKAGYFDPKLVLPFLASIPFAFFGGMLVLPIMTLALIFAGALFAASISLLSFGSKIELHRAKIIRSNLSIKQIAVLGVPIGVSLGTLAGIVGIGGGIWLSPLLILMGLANSKQAGAAASLFILLNSTTGFIANSISKPIDISLLIPLALSVTAGGLIGSRYGAFKLNHDYIRKIIGLLVAAAATLLIFRFFL